MSQLHFEPGYADARFDLRQDRSGNPGETPDLRVDEPQWLSPCAIVCQIVHRQFHPFSSRAVASKHLNDYALFARVLSKHIGRNAGVEVHASI